MLRRVAQQLKRRPTSLDGFAHVEFGSNWRRDAEHKRRNQKGHTSTSRGTGRQRLLQMAPPQSNSTFFL
jgi:hypothetical protein